jgi:antitoxin component YwqK of YwqJK toxin-antitoxin module
MKERAGVICYICNMKPLLILILSLSFTLTAFGQQDSGFTNKAEAKNLMVNGLKEGKWVEYENIYGNFSTDTSYAECYRLTIYHMGKPLGIARQYYMNNKIWCETPYNNGRRNGIEKWYYSDGKALGETTYNKGEKIGIEHWYYENGILKSETPYTNDKESGIRKTYFENGVLESETPFTNGKINGVDKEYYENSNLKYEYPRTYNKNNGVLKEYYENGKLESEYPYSNDTINGIAKKYYENGIMMSQTQFVKGREKGTKYYSNKGNEILLEQIKNVSPRFNWSDTSFIDYSKRIINITYLLDGPCTVQPCYESRDNHFVYDTLVRFLKTHPSIEIEIASHFNRGGNHRNSEGVLMSDDWSKLKANYMKQVLVEKGIPSDQIIAIGYGNIVPILSEQEIKKLPKDKQDYIRFKNTRIEIIIIENGSKR